MAGVTARDDWAHALPDALALDAPTRAALASAWLDDARLEHASIASFARFTLHMLALGAPPELVEAAQIASLDEIAHARACFALATRYARAAIGPGALPVDGSLGAVTLADAAAAAAREGCVGETLAALLAAEQLAGATDPEARQALTAITRGEAVHAELAYRFVGWAIAQGGEVVRDAVAAAFAGALAAVARPRAGGDPEGIDADVWRAHGRLTAAEARAVERATLLQVIAPCVRALLAPADERPS